MNASDEIAVADVDNAAIEKKDVITDRPADGVAEPAELPQTATAASGDEQIAVDSNTRDGSGFTAPPGTAAPAVADKEPLVETFVETAGCPVVAGEDPAQFRKIVEELIAEYKPQTLRAHFLVDDIANSQWKIKRIDQSGRWLTNAAIAKSLHRQVVNKTVVQRIEKNRAAGGWDPVQAEETLEGTFRQGWWRQWENTAFAAASGNAAAIELIEEKLGRNAVSLNAFVDVDALSSSLILLERAAMLARAIRDGGFRLLDKIEKKRPKQKPEEKIGAERTASGSSAGADVPMPDPTTDPVTGDRGSSHLTVSVHIPKDPGETDGESQ